MSSTKILSMIKYRALVDDQVQSAFWWSSTKSLLMIKYRALVDDQVQRAYITLACITPTCVCVWHLKSSCWHVGSMHHADILHAYMCVASTSSRWHVSHWHNSRLHVCGVYSPGAANIWVVVTPVICVKKVIPPFLTVGFVTSLLLQNDTKTQQN
jgi:hypothetical protein